MKKIAIAIILVLLIFATGCSAKNIDNSESSQNVTGKSDLDEVIEHHEILKGESESWTGELKLDSTETFYTKDGVLCYDSEANNLLTIKFKGDMAYLHSAKRILISCESSTLEIVYDNDNEIDSEYSLGFENILRPDENNIIKAEIALDGNVETIEFKSKE